jgi:hypothetical protein
LTESVAARSLSISAGGAAMSILRKHLNEIRQQDLDELCENTARETSELEFKGALPFQPVRGQPETADRWVTRGDRVGDYARDKLLTELVAFANADGGTLVLGIEETDDEPRRARGLSPLPRCEDLARRLADACEDVIEPRLPIVDARALPLVDGDGSGFVIMRVGRSAAGPHRLVSDGQFYIRRGERSVKMAVREIRDAVLDLARRGDTVEALFRQQRQRDTEVLREALAGAASPEAHAVLLRATAIPAARWQISNLTTRPELWWTGDEHEATIGNTRIRMAFPAREFRNHHRVALRTLRYENSGFVRSVTADGMVDARFVHVSEPELGRGRPESAPLYWSWVISLVCGVLAQVEHLRRAMANDGAEFGLQLAIEADRPLMPTWHEHDGFGRPQVFQDVEFPILPVGPAARFDDLINIMVRDVSNHCGSNFDNRIEIDWQRLVGVRA